MPVQYSGFSKPLPVQLFISVQAPSAVVLDWRLENELSAALYLATRHRYPQLPVIYWTGSVESNLPDMVRGDAMTVVVEACPHATEEAEREMSAHELTHHIKSVVGVTVGVRVVDPGAIERSQGKAKRVVDLRPKA